MRRARPDQPASAGAAPCALGQNPMPNPSTRAHRAAWLSQAQREAFIDRGVVRLPAVIPPAATAIMLDRLWAGLEAQHRLLRGRPETWTRDRAWQLRDLRRADAFAPMLGDELCAALDAFFEGAGWQRPPHPGMPLVTFPSRTEWVLPHQSWHLDILPGVVLEPWPDHVRVFVLLAPLAPGGGGTLYVAGSHRLAMQVMAETPSRSQIRSAAVVEALKRRSAWVAALCSPEGQPAERVRRFMQEGGAAAGVRLEVGEMTGKAGDVLLMHPGVLHAGAPNAGATPRLMLAETIRALG